jgi:deoxyadenosine/deoxycytidine kinase
MHIAISGNIGVGKTTLTKLISSHYGWNAHYETVDENPYLNDFYNDMPRWSFNLQVYFLHNRFAQIRDIQSSDVPVIQDRTIYEDAYIFAPNLYEMGLMTLKDFTTYQDLFNTIRQFIRPPDLLIYLKSPVSKLVEQINNRGREFEDSIRLDYLKSLNKRYDNWIEHYQEGKKIVVDVDGIDFVNKQEDLGAIISKIDAEINGLF